ncbi:MAG: class II aldolase/adducin family protein [Verrucomicrobia bacterium]|nr:class II aldolase/adducin family protein [Verrucomicrobiota bacterium]
MNEQSLESILRLCHQLGSPEWRMAILGEGNASIRLDEETFAVKGSGHSLLTLEKDGLAICNFNPLVAVAEGSKEIPDSDVLLLESQVNSEGTKPSTEAVFHAWLLTLPGVNFVAHAHPIALNQILCTKHGKRFASRRLFPDQVVCCQSKSLWIPYVDPGIDLAREIKRRTHEFISENGTAPNTFLLQNHGLIAVGPTADAAWGAMQMMEKAAQIYVGAASISKNSKPVFMPSEEVDRIAGRPDEKYRRQILKFVS